MKRLLASTALATLLATGTVFAQTPAEKAPDAAQQQMQRPDAAKQDMQKPDAAKPQTEMQQKAPEKADKADKAADQATPGSLKFVQSQKQTDWLASTLKGRAVKDPQGDTLGDINDVILDQNGSVIAVLIGVGGFLGIGEKEVGVAFDSLEFQKKAVKQPTQSPGAVPRPDAAQRPGGPAPAPAPRADRKDYSHSDMEVVLNATREQLEAAPQFVRIGDTPKAKDTTTSAPDAKKE